jgi:LCP family protein required for cell wall assembly
LPENYTGPGLFRKFVLGALLIVAASASATAVAAFREIDRVGDAFRLNPGLQLGGELAQADRGKPQTIMIVGSDKRAKTARDVQTGFAGGARADTVILLRLDPSKEATAVLSLPRDLKVEIPGHGTDKLNAAFAIGGVKLTLRTVKRFTGLRINHVINVDFRGFREAVNAIRCVYMDIDRRYFNDNSSGDQYATIDVKQGYQRLCGQSALDYVRYRHEDNDLVRAARQQEFLRQAKAQVGLSTLIEDRDRLLEIFGRYTRSDIRSNATVARLLNLALASAGHPIREVHFRGEITAGDQEANVPSYVIARSAVVRQVTDEFLGVKATKGPRAQLRTSGRKHRRRRVDVALEDAPADGKQQALKALAGGARIPIYYPRKRPRGSLFAGDPRVYAIRDPDGNVHNSYRMVIRLGLIGQFAGLQGTAWKDPPVLNDPSEKRTIRGREYELFYDGDRLRIVAWRTRDGVYWVSNTLLQTLNERQMIEIAKSARTLGS